MLGRLGEEPDVGGIYGVDNELDLEADIVVVAGGAHVEGVDITLSRRQPSSAESRSWGRAKATF